MNELYTNFLELAKTAVPYFGQWTYTHPMIVTQETNETMRFLQKAMYTSIRHFVENYDAYRHLMPVSEQVSAILSLCKDVPYRPGTYRTDFLIDENKRIRLIEITCRFALNGFLRSGFFHLLADRFIQEHPQVVKIDPYTAFFDELAAYFGAFSHVCLLKDDKFNEGRYLKLLFQSAGYPVHVLELDDIPARLDLLEHAAVIGQLRHDELCALSLPVVERIIHSNLINDLRTVLLIHDKRFFAVLGNDDFLHTALSKANAERFRAHLVPTWGWHERRDLWAQARQHKEDWVIKPRALGMGIGVKAGCLTAEAEWQAVFSQADVEDLTLQPYVPQARFHGWVGEEERREDYVVGTLLFFEDHYFGPGLFRASSCPITNQGDDRKIAPLVSPAFAGIDERMVI
ncbi:MAG: hypothetical protein FJ011_18905 [Chloroflexi bacterium]|nr:hypothetical protein [Chloroflexota bacterium]